jgi:hypothetical protein
MSPLSWKDRLPDPQQPTQPCSQAICDPFTKEQPESSGDSQSSTVQMSQLPQLYPLKYFPSTGKPIFNLKYIMQQAHTYVSKLEPSTAIEHRPSSSSYGRVSESKVFGPESSEGQSVAASASGSSEPAAMASGGRREPADGSTDGGQTAVILADVEAKLSALQRRLDLLQKRKA